MLKSVLAKNYTSKGIEQPKVIYEKAHPNALNEGSYNYLPKRINNSHVFFQGFVLPLGDQNQKNHLAFHNFQNWHTEHTCDIAFHHNIS